MALASFFLVIFDGEQEKVCRSGWIYLVATHLGAMFLLVFFVLMADEHGSSLDFGAHVSRVQGIPPGLLFALSLIGFGSKAGLVPMHVWLPEAYPAAPAPVTALLSAAMSKMGIYGLLRSLTLLGTPEPWWGLLLMALGMISALIAVGEALYQRDLKRVLAFSSIEHVGLIVFGIGLGLWGVATGHGDLAALGFAAALLHCWNHALLKGMIFLAAGSLTQNAGTRDLEKLGGLARRMPWTGALLILGAVALAGLPPLNFFVSEWLLYLGLLQFGLFQSGGLSLTALLAFGCLAFVGGLAAIAFARLVGIACLGEPRSEGAATATEPGVAMRWPMLWLGGSCLVSAIAPALLLAQFANVLHLLLGFDGLARLESSGLDVQSLGWVNLGIAALALGVAALFAHVLRRNGTALQPTWTCAYAAPTPRMQYTASSFAEMMAENLMPRPFRPGIKQTPISGCFPGVSRFESDDSDPLAQRGYLWLFDWIGRTCMRLWWVQHGTINLYLLYLMIAVVLGLAWMSIRTW